jgi:hypothetical protein
MKRNGSRNGKRCCCIGEAAAAVLYSPKFRARSLLIFGLGYGFERVAYKAQWGVEDTPMRRDLTRLYVEECTLYDDLIDKRLRTPLL